MKFITATSLFYIADAASLSADGEASSLYAHDPSDVAIYFTCGGADELNDSIQVSLSALNKVGGRDSTFSTMLPSEDPPPDDVEPQVSPSETIPLVAPPGISCTLVKEVLQWIDSLKRVETLPTITRPLTEGQTPREILENSGFFENYFQLVQNEKGALKDFDELTHLSTVAEYLGLEKIKEVIHAAMAADLMQRCKNDTIGALVDEWRAQEKTKNAEASSGSRMEKILEKVRAESKRANAAAEN